MNKSINTFRADQNVIQSLEQQFDYLFNPIQCGGGAIMAPPIVSSISLERLELRASNFLTFSFYLLAVRKI